MRHGLAVAVATLALGCGPAEDDLRARARAALERDRYEELTLTAAPDEPAGTFDFRGTREGERCEGTIQVRVQGDRQSSSIQARCGAGR